MPAGIIKELNVEDRSYYIAADIMELLGVSRDKAYRMIRALRSECIAEGTLTNVYPVGKIPKKYFNQKCMLE